MADDFRMNFIQVSSRQKCHVIDTYIVPIRHGQMPMHVDQYILQFAHYEPKDEEHDSQVAAGVLCPLYYMHCLRRLREDNMREQSIHKRKIQLESVDIRIWYAILSNPDRKLNLTWEPGWTVDHLRKQRPRSRAGPCTQAI